MKQLTTILMLILIGYNCIGYYFVFKLKHQKAEQEFTEYINSGSYAETDLALFKVPVAQYSEMSSSDFNRVEGDFEQNGKFYEIVRQSIENDTVYVYCLNNEKEEQLYANLADHINNHIVDSKSTKSKSTGKALHELTNEYLPKEDLRVSLTSQFILWEPDYYTTIEDLRSLERSIPTPPPQLV